MTDAEIQKLVDTDYCTWTWVSSYNGTGVSGWVVKGAQDPYKDNEVFFSAAGRGCDKRLVPESFYRSSTPDSGSSVLAWGLYFDTTTFRQEKGFYRSDGGPVRPVRDAPVGQPVGVNARLVQEGDDWKIVGTGVATNLPAGFNLDSITNLIVQDGVTEIGARFFKKCRKLNTITLGKDVVKVGEKAFYLCLSLERIVAEDSAVVSSIADAVVYQTAIRPDGSLYTIPSITVPGYVEVLYGTDDLAKPNWKKVDAGKTMEESGYHFFKYVLEEAK